MPLGSTLMLLEQGTTNLPKGVVLSHKNLALSTYSNLYGLELPDQGILMSYLPLAHIYEVCRFCCVKACSA
jgi:long-chain acyl-CoA synthetase